MANLGLSFKKATRENVWLKLGMVGVSGSGKTYSALRVATGIAEKEGSEIAFISSEKSRSLYYADKFNYDVLELPNYECKTYEEAINAAVNAGYKVIVIDSLTHAWAELNRIHDSMTGNSFQNWGKLKPLWKSLMQKILGAPAHIIVCSRAKTEWSIDVNANGKSTPTKVGMGVDGDKSQEYEYTINFSLAVGTHIASTSDGGKDNTGMYDNKYIVLTEEDGRKLWTWSNVGIPASEIPTTVSNPTYTLEEDELNTVQSDIISLCKSLGGTKNENLMTTLKRYTPSGNPKAIKDISVANDCLSAIKALA